MARTIAEIKQEMTDAFMAERLLHTTRPSFFDGSLPSLPPFFLGSMLVLTISLLG